MTFGIIKAQKYLSLCIKWNLSEIPWGVKKGHSKSFYWKQRDLLRNTLITNKTQALCVQLENTLILLGSPKIFLIVTNVARTNVSWTNVTITVEICSSQELTIKVWSETAEIFLIWTNVARTNVAWTNVNLIVGICSRHSHEATFKVSSKSRQ